MPVEARDHRRGHALGRRGEFRAIGEGFHLDQQIPLGQRGDNGIKGGNPRAVTRLLVRVARRVFRSRPQAAHIEDAKIGEGALAQQGCGIRHDPGAVGIARNIGIEAGIVMHDRDTIGGKTDVEFGAGQVECSDAGEAFERVLRQ
jgi:hypothetical protein